MIQDDHGTDARDSPWFSLSRSAIWKVAGILVGIQTTTGLLAIVLSAYFAYDQSLDFVKEALRIELDKQASEIEQRSFGSSDGHEKVFSLEKLPESLIIDLTTRFPDPLTLLDENGGVIRTIQPDPAAFKPGLSEAPIKIEMPSGIRSRLQEGEVYINVDGDEEPDGVNYGVAPIFDASGKVVGGLLLKPLNNSIQWKFEGTYDAFYRAINLIIAFSLFSSLLIGGFFTWRIVQPLRNIMQQVESIGAGDYSVRVYTRSEDELGRLANAINNMAGDVENSVQALKETDKLRRQMIANFGHDLRTPLAALLGYLEETTRYLESGHKDSAMATVATAERQGKYLQKLIGDLFELSLLDSAQAPLRKEPIPLAELLSDAANTHRQAMKKDGITFNLDLPQSLPMIEGDGVRLLRVLDNLMSNARNHTPENGAVTLKAEVLESQIQVSVTDTGCGMDEDELAHIFDRYYSGSGPRTRRKKGTGLGLPISWAIAKAHGGSLTAESEVGVGSRFILSLPLTIKENPVSVV